MPEADRRARLLATFEADGLDGMVVSSTTNVGYLTGFTGDDSTLLLTPDRAILVSDGRYALQVAEECPDLEPSIRPIGQPMPEALGGLARRLGLARLGFEGQATTVADFRDLAEAADGVELVATKGRVESLRKIKDPTEVAAIREAIAMAERAFADLRAWLRPGVTEKAAADFLENALRRAGATAASFPPIVASGPRSALPHARPSQTAVIERDSPILIDWGASGRPYKSDLTRVVTAGKVTPDFARAYGIVLEAQRRAIAAVRPGVMARDVDAAARGVIEEAGHGADFLHSVGHGIGRDVHEAPTLRHVSEARLGPGMVVTVEPGIYLPGWGGIRIEDDVLVTESGCEVLSASAKTLDSVVL